MKKFVSCMLAVAFLAFGSSQSQASVVLTAEEVGGNVVISGGGTLNLEALSYFATFDTVGGTIGPQYPFLAIGNAGSVDTYTGAVSGPLDFGPGNGGIYDDYASYSRTTNNTGSMFGFDLRAPALFIVPEAYVSNTLLVASSIFEGTFASLGLSLGTFVWSWGDGANADSFTLNVGVAAVPLPAGLSLLAAGLGALGFVGWRKKRSANTATPA